MTKSTDTGFKALVVMGVAGCGKTSLGEALAASLGWPFIEGDAFHAPASIAKMQAGQPLTDADREGWLDRLGGMLAAQAPVVLSCSALKRSYRDRLRAACPGLGFVFLEIDRELALQRTAARADGHFFPASLVDSQFQALESPAGEPGVLTVPAALAPQAQLLQALSGLAAPAMSQPDTPHATALQPPEPAAPPEPPKPAWLRLSETAMGLCLAVMAVAVFLNVVLRYGFGSGVAASEELSRLLFVWMVFIGATAAYPLGEHMAFTSLLLPLKRRPRALAAVAALIRVAVLAAAGLVAWGAWQQVVVGLDSTSVVLGYSNALLPLPALLSGAAIALMAAWQLLRRPPLDLGHGADVE